MPDILKTMMKTNVETETIIRFPVQQVPIEESITFSLKQGNSDYLGIDCLDDGVLEDDSADRGENTTIPSLTAEEIGATVSCNTWTTTMMGMA